MTEGKVEDWGVKVKEIEDEEEGKRGCIEIDGELGSGKGRSGEEMM